MKNLDMMPLIQSALADMTPTTLRVEHDGIDANFVDADGNRWYMRLYRDRYTEKPEKPSAEEAVPPAAEPVAPPPANDTPAASPAPPIDPTRARAAGELEALHKAKMRVYEEIHRILPLGGKPELILGFDPHKFMRDKAATSATVEALIPILAAWAPDKPSAVEKNVTAKRVPPPSDAPHPANSTGPPMSG